MKEISGCGTALITPFTSTFEVDYPAFRVLVQRQLDAGINFLVPLGTTGETPCLEDYEKHKILEITQDVNNGKVAVVAGVGSNYTKKVIENIKSFSKFNADAFLVVVPYYNKPTQQGIFEHFRAVSESTSTPIILYNVPGRTGTNMSSETTLRLAELKNIVAVKEASGIYSQISEIIKFSPKGFSVLSGNDDETLPLMSTGAKGIISVASNIAPKHMVQLAQSLKERDTERAQALHHKLMPLFKACFVESNPIPTKAALSLMKLTENVLRLPLVSSSSKTDQLMSEVLKELKLL
ncbi:MAG: 4-hydroxy-tetrahydrodipicolinate synthase [Bacteroidetes bacterium HGW-Bacteroidetes-5]|jgi:4-hydroxy-tetrahydrodipicolinate synthase|nr:MAG: 4-hydroxy-tetrahydrodipicolinate synthase [Bacteroidetes bacterium HGW-Bacteroidetes-5]